MSVWLMATGWLQYYVGYNENTSIVFFFYQRRDDKPPIGSNVTWHDEVDITECFQDTAVLYGILIVFGFSSSSREVDPFLL